MVGKGGLSETAQEMLRVVAAKLPSGPIVVALSGGPDSAATAWAVAATATEVRAISVDHHLPGSSRLMEAAAGISSAIGIDHRVVPAGESGHSETALRTTRLAALEAAADDAETIVTGHTKNDMAETVLGNVLRGTGTTGLAGIPVARHRFVRPILGFTRAQTRRVAVEAGLRFVDDPQNDDPEIRRNRLRRETIPALADAYNPRLVEALARLGESAAADDAVLSARAQRVPVRRGAGTVQVPAAALATLPVAVAARVARRAIRLASPGPYAGTAADVLAVLAAVEGTRTTILAGVDVLREGPWVTLVSSAVPRPESVEVRVGSEVRFDQWSVTAYAAAPELGRFSLRVAPGPAMWVRAPRDGDRISLEVGSKSVSDALAEARVPTRLRPRWPVLESDGRIVWVAGVRAAPQRGSPRDVTVRMVRRPK